MNKKYKKKTIFTNLRKNYSYFFLKLKVLQRENLSAKFCTNTEVAGCSEFSTKSYQFVLTICECKMMKCSFIGPFVIKVRHLTLIISAKLLFFAELALIQSTQGSINFQLHSIYFYKHFAVMMIISQILEHFC